MGTVNQKFGSSDEEKSQNLPLDTIESMIMEDEIDQKRHEDGIEMVISAAIVSE